MLDPHSIQQAHTVDLLRLLEPDTPLRRIAGTRGGEYAGPCPFCGGEDRLHVAPRSGRWYCRRCTPRGGDSIDYIMRLRQLAFSEAVAFLTGDQTPPHVRNAFADGRPPQPQQSPAWQQAAELLVEQACRNLDGSDGRAAQAYLAGRGLTAEAWQAWRLGCRLTYHPALERELPAITLPWYTASGGVTAVQYRFFAPGLARHERFSQKPGGERVLFGLPLLRGRETLLLCEGELNAVSLWQVAHGRVDVLSFGMQDALAPGDGLRPPTRRQTELAAAVQQLAAGYRQVVVWADEAPRAQTAAHTFGGAHGRALWSEQQRDANDLLVAGCLDAYLCSHGI